MKLFNLFKKKEKPIDAKVIYRVDVLRYAKKHKGLGLCDTLYLALMAYGIPVKCNIESYFPLFNRSNAFEFNANDILYWWEAGVWNTGREDFLNWLIKQYKKDKTNLRKL